MEPWAKRRVQAANRPYSLRKSALLLCTRLGQACAYYNNWNSSRTFMHRFFVCRTLSLRSRNLKSLDGFARPSLGCASSFSGTGLEQSVNLVADKLSATGTLASYSRAGGITHFGKEYYILPVLLALLHPRESLRRLQSFSHPFILFRCRSRMNGVFTA